MATADAGELPQQLPEYGFPDVDRFSHAQGCAAFTGGCGQPGVQVPLVTEEIHQGASGFRDAASVSFREPDHRGQRRCLLECAAMDVYQHRLLTEKTP